MSWYSKVCLFTIPLFLTLSAWGQRVEFNRNGSKAIIESHLLNRSAEVSPIEIKLTVPYVDLEKNRDGFQSINVDGLVPLSTPGNPEIGVTGQLVIVPEGYRAELSIVEQHGRDLSDVVVNPAQRKFRCGGELDSFSYNSALYDSKGLYPAQVVSLEEVGKLQGVKIMRVAMNPLQMDFAKGALHVTTDIRVQIHFNRVEGTRSETTVLPRTFYRLARTIAANGQGLGALLRADTAPEHMLIIVADSLKDNLQPLLKWKSQKGITTQVYTTTEAGGKKEEIKKFIQKYYDTHSAKPSYLLMVGNKDTAPTYMESTASGSAASDWQYTLLSGSDNIPDVFYGRLAADDANELKVQISRWIDYEKTPENAGTWYHDGMTIASNEGSGPSDKEYAIQVQDALKKYTYKSMDSFFAGDQNATAENIANAVKGGRSWISYFGHGSGTSWASTNDTFSNTEVGQLNNNGGRLPVIIDVACQNGSWVKLPKCFGKAWVTQVAEGKNAGAVAFYGGSVNISWHPPAVMSVGVSKYHFEKGIASLGGSVLAGQLYLIEKMGTGNDTLDNMKWYNLLGDPSLVVRTNTPLQYRVKKQITRIRDGVTVAVTATDDSGKGVSGLNVSVASENRGTLAVGKTDASGQATLTMPAIGMLEPDTLLTLTGYNAETTQISISN